MVPVRDPHVQKAWSETLVVQEYPPSACPESCRIDFATSSGEVAIVHFDYLRPR